MPRYTHPEQLSSLRKAAVFMVSIGADSAAQIFKYLSESDIERLSAEIARVENVPTKELNEVNDEFHNMILAQKYISAGGLSYAEEILEGALGGEKALAITRRVQMTLEVKGFNVLEDVDVTQLLAFLQKEHPQTIALVLSQLTPIQAANVLAELPTSVQVDVVHRIALMERITPETLRAVEKVLESHIDLTRSTSKFGGIKTAAEVLNMVGQRFEKNILAGISKEDAELASEIKNLMFVFEDIIKLDDRSIQRLLKDVDNKELAMSLKACSTELKDKILNNMSKRASDLIREEIDYMGPVRLREVEVVQQRIVDTIRRLEEDGDIYVSAGVEDALV